MCSRCGKNVAIVFITRVEGNEQKNEGLCLKCARELHIKPVDDMLEKMGISDEDLDSLSGDMMNALSGVESLMDIENGGGDDDSDDDGKTATFPFLNRLFGGNNGGNVPADSSPAPNTPPKEGGKQPKRKFLDNYCINLTDRARAGELDNMVGREEELERVIQILNRRQNDHAAVVGCVALGSFKQRGKRSVSTHIGVYGLIASLGSTRPREWFECTRQGQHVCGLSGAQFIGADVLCGEAHDVGIGQWRSQIPSKAIGIVAFEDQWEVGIVGQPAFTQLTADTFVVISGLQNDSAYTAYVRAICSEGDTSVINTVSFQTASAGGEECIYTMG